MKSGKVRVSTVLALNLKRLREQRGLTLEELGDSIGVTKQAIWALENENSWITLDKVKKLSAYFKIEEHELFSKPSQSETK
ncbi:MAG: Helix-turn-helix domain protein [bacterium ADurb.BinA186]|nr:MAG: Helix-turn-helix domain protein [bacterium ADurb.BinA186]